MSWEKEIKLAAEAVKMKVEADRLQAELGTAGREAASGV